MLSRNEVKTPRQAEEEALHRRRSRFDRVDLCALPGELYARRRFECHMRITRSVACPEPPLLQGRSVWDGVHKSRFMIHESEQDPPPAYVSGMLVARVALFAEGIAVHVIAAQLPEAR